MKKVHHFNIKLSKGEMLAYFVSGEEALLFYLKNLDFFTVCHL